MKILLDLELEEMVVPVKVPVVLVVQVMGVTRPQVEEAEELGGHLCLVAGMGLKIFLQQHIHMFLIVVLAAVVVWGMKAAPLAQEGIIMQEMVVLLQPVVTACLAQLIMVVEAEAEKQVMLYLAQAELVEMVVPE